MGNFVVNELVKIDNNSKILARGVVVTGGVALKFALLPSSQGDPWVALPSREYKDNEGNRKFEKQCWPLDEDSTAELQAVVLSAYNKSASNTSPNKQQGSNNKKTNQIPF